MRLGSPSTLCAGVVLVWASALGLAATPSAAVRQTTTNDGIYSKAQADAAKPQFDKLCAACHAFTVAAKKQEKDLPLGDEPFLKKWEGRSLDELATVIVTTMPNDGSAIVSDEETLNLLAYILQQNGFPAGKAPLTKEGGAATLVRPKAATPLVPADYQAVLAALGKTGDFKDGVLKVNISRSDITVMIAGRPAPTPFGFGGWVAFSKGDQDMDVMMGDLVLTEDEVNPVMSAVLTNGLEVTALHNHFFWDQPRMFYMHVHGHGTAAAIAKQLKPAVDLINGFAAKRPKPVAPAAPASTTPALDTAAVAKIIGTAGEQNGPVYKITIGRPDIEMREHGALVNSRMGLNTWAAFTGTDADAMVAGDVAMLESEVTPVLTALRAGGLSIVAIHHHMADTRPVVIFLHYFGTGPAAQLAKGVRGALDLLKKPAARR